MVDNRGDVKFLPLSSPHGGNERPLGQPPEWAAPKTEKEKTLNLHDPHTQISEVLTRLDALEQKVISLEAALLVKSELGGELIEREEGGAKGDVEGVESDRSVVSARATTAGAEPLHRNFRPSMFGYTADDFKRDYPDVNPNDVLESFFSHHVGKGDRSKNWLEKFWSYAHRAQQIERERKMSNPVETDSMGLPTDRKARREMLGQ